MKQNTPKTPSHAGAGDSMTSKVIMVAKVEFPYQPQSNTNVTARVEASDGEGNKSAEPRNFFLK